MTVRRSSPNSRPSLKSSPKTRTIARRRASAGATINKQDTTSSVWTCPTKLPPDMQNTSSRPDPSTLPVLTDVVELPFDPAPPPAPEPKPDPAPDAEQVSIAASALAEAVEKAA